MCFPWKNRQKQYETTIDRIQRHRATLFIAQQNYEKTITKISATLAYRSSKNSITKSEVEMMIRRQKRLVSMTQVLSSHVEKLDGLKESVRTAYLHVETADVMGLSVRFLKALDIDKVMDEIHEMNIQISEINGVLSQPMEEDDTELEQELVDLVINENEPLLSPPEEWHPVNAQKRTKVREMVPL